MTTLFTQFCHHFDQAKFPVLLWIKSKPAQNIHLSLPPHARFSTSLLCKKENRSPPHIYVSSSPWAAPDLFLHAQTSSTNSSLIPPFQFTNNLRTAYGKHHAWTVNFCSYTNTSSLLHAKIIPLLISLTPSSISLSHLTSCM
jgi:hypothetical protein